MDVGEFEITVKVIVVGNGGVGKTSMTTLYAKGRFTDTYKKTIGVDFMEKVLEVEDAPGEPVRLMIWDTAGQEVFDSLTSRYYKGAGIAVLVFSTTDRESFEALPSWKRKVEDECGPIPMAMVQNKIDMIDSAAMTPTEVEDMARQLNVKLYRSCVKDNVNVAKVFEDLVKKYIQSGAAMHQSAAPVASIADLNAASSPHGAAAAGSSVTTAAERSRDRIQLDRPAPKQRTGGKKSRFCTVL